MILYTVHAVTIFFSCHPYIWSTYYLYTLPSVKHFLYFNVITVMFGMRGQEGVKCIPLYFLGEN